MLVVYFIYNSICNNRLLIILVFFFIFWVHLYVLVKLENLKLSAVIWCEVSLVRANGHGSDWIKHSGAFWICISWPPFFSWNDCYFSSLPDPGHLGMATWKLKGNQQSKIWSQFRDLFGFLIHVYGHDQIRGAKESPGVRSHSPPLFAVWELRMVFAFLMVTFDNCAGMRTILDVDSYSAAPKIFTIRPFKGKFPNLPSWQILFS